MTLCPVIGTPFAVVAIAWLVLGALGLAKQRRSAAGRPPQEKSRARYPLVHVIIPCTYHAHLRAHLLRHADQDYPSYVLTCVTATAEEEASEVITELAMDRPHVRHVVAGGAARCGQKNQNLLAALTASAAPEAEVLVFCDDDVYPRQRAWLGQFVASVADPAANRVASTWHNVPVMPRPALADWVYAATCFFMGVGMWASAYHVWGGATAIHRTLFEELGVAGQWARTVSDDVVLSRCLRRARQRRQYVPCCELEDTFQPRSLGAVVNWAARQLQMLKLYDAPSFWGIGVLILVSLGTFLALPLSLAWECGQCLAPVVAVCQAAFWLFAGLCVWALQPRAGFFPLLRHALLTPVALLMICYAYFRSLVLRDVFWKTKRYVMDGEGQVAEIREE